MKIGGFLSFGHAELKSENENTVSLNVRLELQHVFFVAFSTIFTKLSSNLQLCNWVRWFKNSFFMSKGTLGIQE